MEGTLSKILEAVQTVQRKVTETKKTMAHMQALKNDHSDASMALESGSKGIKEEAGEMGTRTGFGIRASEKGRNGGNEGDTVDESLLPLTQLLHRVLDRAGDVSDKQSYVLAACTRALSKFELTAKLKDQAKWVEIVKVSMETNDCGNLRRR